MTGGFDANVPARKPRTRIARVISELTSGSDDAAEHRPAVVEDAAPTLRDAVAAARGHGPPDRVPAHDVPDVAAPASGPSPAAPPKGISTAASPVSGGREQIARLRERLAAAAHVGSRGVEPKRTAAAVREMVEGLRARLEASARERSELAEALEEARAGMARAGGDLERERRAREGLEAQAEERRRVADDAVAEAEALAAERDQVLGELTEHRRLDAERASLLTEIEAALAQRDAERESAARELAEARDLAEIRAAELADLEARLEEEATGRARADARCRELEAEIVRLSEAHEALESIEAVLGHRRGNQGGDTA